MVRTVNRKICLLGDMAVGKTSLQQRFVHNRFDERYLATIGVTVSRKTVAVPVPDGPVELTLIVWDLAGSDEWGRMRASYLRGAAGAVLVCDVLRPESLDNLLGYAEELRRVNPAARVVVAGNKHDLASPGHDSGAIEELAGGIGAPWLLTSAKTGLGVEAVFRRLGDLLAETVRERETWTP